MMRRVVMCRVTAVAVSVMTAMMMIVFSGMPFLFPGRMMVEMFFMMHARVVIGIMFG